RRYLKPINKEIG
ncbi:hypothetical protein D049_3506B, partial [Vibrio parahaemolyticus VPTS-2010]